MSILNYSKNLMPIPLPKLTFIHIKTRPTNSHCLLRLRNKPPQKLPISSMANRLLCFALSLLLLLLLLISTPITSATQNPKFIRSQKPLSKNHEQQMKLSHLRFYFHDILGGRNPTAVTVAEGPTTNTSATSFGLVNMIDDPLTVGPAADSKLLGRAQGLYAAASQESLAVMMAMNFVFVEGKYNGSTITILGRNPAVKGAKEMPVVGGSGLFRFARGYVEARTVSWDPKTGDACVRYDCYVMHY